MKSRYVWAVVLALIFMGGCSTPEREAASLLKSLPQVSPPVLDEARAVELVKLSLNCVEREFPYKIGYRFDSEEWIKPHYEVTPSFYGCWDWHSAVHGHWTMTKILKMFPNISVGDSIRSNLADGLAVFREATAWIINNGVDDPNEALAAATPYLKMFGQVVGGWLLARLALGARRRLDEGTGDSAHLEGKIVVARFYAEQLLPTARAQLGAVTAGASDLFAMSADGFSA